jgi:hypothetical protein
MSVSSSDGIHVEKACEDVQIGSGQKIGGVVLERDGPAGSGADSSRRYPVRISRAQSRFSWYQWTRLAMPCL